MNIKIENIFLVIFFLGISIINAQSFGNDNSESTEYKIGDVRLLNPPNRDAPTEVYVSFHLQDVDEIDDQLETFHLV